jgi:peptidoglycan/LPS O-acetylase OafA/YrhL
MPLKRSTSQRLLASACALAAAACLFAFGTGGGGRDLALGVALAALAGWLGRAFRGRVAREMDRRERERAAQRAPAPRGRRLLGHGGAALGAALGLGAALAAGARDPRHLPLLLFAALACALLLTASLAGLARIRREPRGRGGP